MIVCPECGNKFEKTVVPGWTTQCTIRCVCGKSFEVYKSSFFGFKRFRVEKCGQQRQSRDTKKRGRTDAR